MFVHDRNITGSSSEVFGYLRKILEKFGENLDLGPRLENLRKSVRKSSDNR